MVGTITNKGITIRQGDSFPLKLYFKDEHGPKDITGSTVLMQVRNSNNVLVISKEGVIENAEQGEVLLSLEPNDTNIELGDYVTDIQITDKNGNVNTIYPQNVNSVAFFRITAQVTDTSA